MNKKKEKSSIRFFRLVARIWIISMPAAIILAILLLWHKITLTTAGLLFLGVLVFTSILTKSVFKELENFIAYLKTLAQGLEIEPPHFNKGIFSTFRLADSFQSVKKIWSNQTLSDASILENLPDPLIMIDEAGIIVFMNQTAQNRFGKTLLKQPINTLFLEEKIRKAIRDILTADAKTEWFEWEKNADAFQVRIDRLPALTRNGAIAVMTMNDITPFKRFKKQQVEFFANASHELKTPLAIISGLIETLQGPAKEDAAAQAQFLNMMADQTGRMTGLVQNLLQLSRRQALPERTGKEVVSLSELLKKIIHELKNRADKKEQTLRFISDKKIPRLLGNRSDLGHAFQNLLDNAIKYGQPNSTITVRLSFSGQSTPKTIRIDVHNYGTPIESKDLGRLFDRFYRGSSTQTRQAEGTGLGLSIVQQIVHDHNGKVDVISTQKDGTTFSVYLPVD